MPSALARAKKARTPALLFAPLRTSLITSVSTRYTSASAVGLLTDEVAVFADVRHVRQDLGKGLSLRPAQGSFQDLPVFLLGTAVTLGRALFQCAHELLRQVSDHYLRHRVRPFRCLMLSMLASSRMNCKHC